MNFPASPANGETVTGPTGAVWQWDGTKWTFVPGGGGGGSVDVGDTPPTGPSSGNLWFNTDDSQLYIFDTDQNQWIVVANQPAVEGPQGPQGPQGPNALPMGVNDGSNAVAGQIGEYIQTIMTANTGLVSGSSYATALTLPPGDWECGAYANFIAVGGQGFTSLSAQLQLGASTYWWGNYTWIAAPSGWSAFTVTFPTVRVNHDLTPSAQFGAGYQATTTGGGNWGLSAPAGNAGLVWARRMR